MIKLIAIMGDGKPSDPGVDVQGAAAEACNAYTDLYKALGCEPPWIGYLAEQNGAIVGTCGFKGPPKDGRVEIAYYTFKDYEGRGVATAMARALVAKAWETDKQTLVTARTLMQENASTRILRKLGFEKHGVVIDPSDGEVWEWVLP